MDFTLENVFNEYPSPLYIIRPLFSDGQPQDFEYLYVNDAFCLFLGKDRQELLDHKYGDVFGHAESEWLDAFAEASRGGSHAFVDNVSTVINKRLYMELFHIPPDKCGCIIHDFKEVPDSVKAHENASLIRKANRDCLTGFYNRFYLNELTEKFDRMRNVGITYLDINNLKQTNDTLGHAGGDRLILKVSGILRDNYGDSMIFRVGGDEFLIITDDTSEEEFMDLSVRVMEIFHRENLVAMGFKFYETLPDLKSCIDECDQLMYCQKRHMKRA